MPDEREESSGFKVVDRRAFAGDGSPRQEAPEEKAEENSAAPPATDGVGADEVFAEDLGQEGQSGFHTLVSYLSTTAMFQLGLLPGPGGERIPVDLVNARMTIDLLDVLQEKTEGNLTSDEAKLLEEVLYELRMSFVQIQQRAASDKK